MKAFKRSAYYYTELISNEIYYLTRNVVENEAIINTLDAYIESQYFGRDEIKICLDDL
jgi:hypothetical protein